MQRISSNEYTLNDVVKKTININYGKARCIDGVVLVADRKINCREESESVYGDKITREITEVLTGFSGDRGNV